MVGPRDDDSNQDAVTTPAGGNPEPEKTTPLGITPSSDVEKTTPYSTGPLSHAASTLPSDTSRLKPLAARYDLLKELGRGGMGVVYRARDRETGDVVALKVLLREIAADQDMVKRFKSELLLARRITHKNVCRVYDLARFNDLAVISMEFVEGEGLRALLKRRQGTSLRQGLDWAKQICNALMEAHAQGVIHRDLKPENILITSEGSAKIMDFGIARSSEKSADPSTGLVIGTPAYMSPEQAQGKTVDSRSDIYSFGLVLYELFTGEQAIQAETPMGLAMKQIHETPRPAHETDRFLPPFLGRAIEKCLHKDPAKRFQSVLELEQALSGEFKADPHGVEIPTALRVWQKNDYVLALVAAVGLVFYVLLQEHVFPARALSLQIDRNVAIKLGQDFAKQMGLERQPVRQVQLRFGTSTSLVDNESIEWTEIRILHGREAAVAKLNEISPFRWLIFLGTPEKPTTVALNARDGSPIAFVRTLPKDGKATTEMPPSIETLRDEAKKELGKVFALEGLTLKLDAETVGSLGAYWTYQAGFSTPETDKPRTRFLAGLTDGKVTFLARSLVKWNGMPDLPWYRSTPGWWGTASRVSMGLMIIGLFAFLAKRALSHWKVALFGAVIAATSSAYLGISGWWISGSLAVDSFLESFALAGINAYLGISLAAELGSQAFPEKLVSLTRPSTLARKNEVVALSVLRGVFLGFCILGFQNILLELGYGTNSFWADPEVLAGPAEAGSPGAHLFLNSILYSLLVTVIGVLLPVSFMAVKYPRKKWLWIVVSALWLVLLSGEFDWLEPWVANVAILFVAGIVLGMVLLKWDVLTLLACLFTFETFLVGYPNLVLFSNIPVYSLYFTFAIVLGALGFSVYFLTRSLFTRKFDDFFSTYR